jgi:LysR family nitrogen assimilation transcriptional regulator
MDFRQLRYFVRIAELGSLSAASHRLGIAQPSLSQHVKHLEEELGVELLVRTSRGVSVTESGKVLLDHASSVLRSLDAAVSDIRDRAGEPRGPVSVAFPSSASNVLSVPLAEAVRRDFPKIILRTMDAMSGHVEQWLTEGAIDIGIIYDVNETRHLRVTPLLTEDLFLIAPASSWPHEFGPDGISRVSVTLAECAELGLILPHRTHGLREIVERFAQTRNVQLKVILEMDALTHLKTLVAHHVGYSILAPAAVTEEVEQHKFVLVPIKDGPLRRTVYLARNPLRIITRAAVEIERLTVELVGDLVRKGIWRGETVAPATRADTVRRKSPVT